MRTIVALGLCGLGLIGVPACGGGGGGDTEGEAGSGTGMSGASGEDPTTGPPPPPPDDGPPPGTLDECGGFEGGTNLNVCTASYLGGAMADTANAVEIGIDGAVVVAGSLVGTDLGATATALAGGGDGAVVRLSASGGAVLSVTRIGQEVLDMSLDFETGDLAIAGPGVGVAVLDATASALVWQQPVEGARRVSIGTGGVVAVLADKTITTYDALGSQLGSFTLMDGNVEDLAVHGTQRVIVTGWNQVGGNLQQPFLRAYSPTGELQWTNYDWSDAEAGGPDTRGMVVTIGRDGKLYYGGESHGGGSSHGQDPRDIAKPAPIVKFDKFNDPYNWNGSAPLAFYARFDPEDGLIEMGQFIVPRLSSGKGNGAGISALAAREDGTVIVGGGSACCIEGGDTKTINGMQAMPDYAGGGFVLVASPQFDQRLVWTAWKGDGAGNGERVTGVAAAGAGMALVMTHGPGDESGAVDGRLVTSKALQFEPAGGPSEAWLSVWPGP